MDTPETQREIAGRLTILRGTDHPDSFERIARRLYATHNVQVSGEQLRLLHNGLTKTAPGRLDLEVIVALADYYGVPVSMISRTVDERIRRLFSHAGPVTDRELSFPGQGVFDLVAA